MLVGTGPTGVVRAPPRSPSAAVGRRRPREAVEPDLALAESTPVEDSVYPAVGHPDVDALLYDLDLAWAPLTSAR